MNRWDVADPEETLDAILARCHAGVGDLVVAMLRCQEGGAREIVDVTIVHSGGPQLDEPRARDLIRRHATSTAPTGPWERGKPRGLDHVFVTVVCRAGRVLPGSTEVFWLRAWRYANHLTDAFDGDTYVLTEHGLTGVHDRRSGFTPALHRSERQPSA